MTDQDDGPWDSPTEHDDQHEIDSADLSDDDPPTTRATDGQRARARGAAIAQQLAGAPGPHAQAGSKAPPSPTLPPPASQRQPAKPARPTDGAPVSGPITTARPTAPGLPLPPKPAGAAGTTPPAQARQGTAPPPPVASRPPSNVGFDDGSVVLLDRVSGNAPVDNSPRRGEAAAGGIVVVAVGPEADRVRKLCHKAGLLVPVMASLAIVHDAMSVVVIGEPSPPAPERVVHVVRPTIADHQLVDLLRALATGRVIVEPPHAGSKVDPKVSEAAQRLSRLTDRGAIEMIAIEAITALTAADRAHCLFHDPASGALWSEARKRNGRDDRQAMGGFVGWAAQTGQPIHASPAGDDPRWLQELDDPDGKPQSRLLVQPIIGADRRVHAVLVAARRWRRPDFTDQERELLASFAALAGPAVDLAVAASPIEPRKPRATLPGTVSGGGSSASRQSAVVSAPRTQGDSRPPPLTARRSPSQQVTVPDGPLAASEPTPPPPGPRTTKLPKQSLDDSQPVPKVEERFSSDSILPLPKPPSVPPANIDKPGATDKRQEKPSEKPADAAVPKLDKRPATGPVRTRSPSDVPKPRSDEPRDLAVVANEEDAKRVQKLAKKARLELSTFGALADAPDFYQVVTIGEAWSETDRRVVYAARSTITDEQLNDLLVGLSTGRAAVPAPGLVRPTSAAEARRAQVAFAGARKLAGATDRAAAEASVMDTIRDLLDTDRAYCLFVEPTTGALWSEARRRAGGDDRHAIAGIAGWAARTGRAVNVPRASGDPRWLAPIDDPDGDPNSQLLVQPIQRADSRVHGVLIAARRARRPGFTDVDASLLARFAGLCGPLIEQLAAYLDTQELVRDDTSAQPPLALANQPLWLAVLRGAHEWSRWAYLAIGAIVAFVLGAAIF